ncbi:MAG: phosphatase YbhA, partial [Frankiales bacterium]|nr:phosphatase YbhA [Frankiales bacterium]
MRLVASDLDGTLLRSDGTVSRRSRAAIASVESAGATFVMVTGRPPRWMRSIAEESGHRGLAICANGAIVYDLHTDAVLDHFLVPAAVAVEVARVLREQIPGVAFAAEHHERPFAHEQAYRPRWDSADPRITTTIEELFQDDVVKLLARHPSLGPDEFLEQA